jgi:hypothetical protein
MVNGTTQLNLQRGATNDQFILRLSLRYLFVRHLNTWLLAVFIFVSSCADEKNAPFDAAVHMADAGSFDAGASLDSGIPKAPFDAGTKPVGPVFGELTFWQLDLPSGFIPKTGEAGILVGPDGTLVLIDVGNSSHADEVKAAVIELNTQWLTVARGYRARAPTEVEWILLTHFHGDHIGAFGTLVGPNALRVTKGVIHRGFVDVGPAVNESDFATMCNALKGPLAGISLCSATTSSPCVIGVERAPAVACSGLQLGDLGVATDDAQRENSFVDLGQGARLELLGVNGFVLNDRSIVAPTPFGVTDVNEENARSIIGLVSHGPFRFIFAGDLSGSGAPTEPDIESKVVALSVKKIGLLGVDVAHANHHARKTSSNVNYVNAMTPNDQRSRNVIAGINSAYVNSPHAETLDAWTAGNRLGSGKLFVTNTGALGATSLGLVNVRGRTVFQTIEAGGGYWISASSFASVRR